MDERSDIRKEPEHGVSTRPIEELLHSTKYVDFYKALSTDDYKPSGLNPDEYGFVMTEFKKRMEMRDNPIEKQLQALTIDITLLSNCLIYIPQLGCGSDDVKLLTKLGIEVAFDLQTTVDNIQIRLNSLITKYQLLEGELPVVKAVVKITGQDMIAELSLGIEMNLSMDLSLLEYISYHRAARNKQAIIKRKSNERSRKN